MLIILWSLSLLQIAKLQVSWSSFIFLPSYCHNFEISKITSIMPFALWTAYQIISPHMLYAFKKDGKNSRLLHYNQRSEDYSHFDIIWIDNCSFLKSSLHCLQRIQNSRTTSITPILSSGTCSIFIPPIDGTSQLWSKISGPKGRALQGCEDHLLRIKQAYRGSNWVQ